MQETSDAFEAAVLAHRTWVPARLRTDWAGDGYDGDGSIDDLSVQMQEGWEVQHTYDDGFPDDVAFVSGTSIPELSATLTGRPDPDTGAPITTPAYWSPLRTDSPVYGYDRDIAPVTLDAGLITSAGPQYVRVFTGQMVNVALRSGEAELSTISAARLKLMKLVQPPAFAAVYSGGLRTTWPVSFALTDCGIYAGPQPRGLSYTAWYAPMHGGAWEMIPSTNRVYSAQELETGYAFPRWAAYELTPSDSSVTPIDEVDWIEGPYVQAPDLEFTATMRRALYNADVQLSADAPDPFSQAGNAARLEMWVKGDATNINNMVGGSGAVTRQCSLWGEVTNGRYFQLGVTPTRYVEAKVYDGGTVHTLTSATPLPSDGAWYFVGAAYDMTADRMWLNLGGTVTSANKTMVTSGLPATQADSWASGYPVFFSNLPVAEITLTTGAQANVDSYPLWRNDTSFAPTARLFGSQTPLNVMAEDEPREAWQIISDYAQGELAAVRFDESDVFEYFPQGWWVRDEQRVVADEFDTSRNAAAFDVDLDPTRIRNTIKVSYTAVDVLPYNASLDNSIIYELDQNTAYEVPPGVTVLRVVYSSRGIMPWQNVAITDNTGLVPGVTSVTLCDTIEGTGTYATYSEFDVTFDAWDAGSATIRFVNHTTKTFYLVNDADYSALTISGLPIVEASTYAVDADLASIEARNVRLLETSASALQTEEAARRLARNLKMSLRKAVPVIGADQQGVSVTANPARQPGGLATFRDRETGVEDGLWRIQGVVHRGTGANYTQSVRARRTYPIMIIGEGRVGETLIGPRDE